MKPLLRLSDVSFTYPGAGSPAMTGVSLEVRRGEVLAVAGRPGSGTTTFLRVAAGFAPRLTGGTLTGGRELLARRPVVVFSTPWTQLTGLSHTVLAEVAFGPAAFGEPRDVVMREAESALERLGIAHLAPRDPETLSGGELQRVIVASALALTPDLLALDDPAAELDPAGADSLYRLLGDVASGGAAVLVATPDLERAATVAARAILLENGSVAADGAPAAVLWDTDVAAVAREAGCPEPWPLDPDALRERLA